MTQVAQSDTEPSGRLPIVRAEDLPRRVVKLDRLPSHLLTQPLDELAGLARHLAVGVASDLDTYDIRDATSLRSMYLGMATVEQVLGNWQAVPRWTQAARDSNEKPGGRAVTGLMADILSKKLSAGLDDDWLATEVARVFGALDWELARAEIKGVKSGFETQSLIIGAIETQLDPVARNGDGSIPEAAVFGLLAARLQLAFIGPATKSTIIEALKAVIDAKSLSEQRPDIWGPRQFTIAEDAVATDVVVGIWDSGVDMSLFNHHQPGGIAYDQDFQPSQDLLRTLGELKDRWPHIRGSLKGYCDIKAGVDSIDAIELRQTLSQLQQAELPGFLEEFNLAANYVHGTHVAGIAVAGNPFARVFTVSMHWSHSIVPFVPSEARAQAAAKAHTEAVAALQAAGARVVNMSWGYGPKMFEDALAYHGTFASPAERKSEAARLFKIERDALLKAMASAEEILFIAAAGNGDNNTDFEGYMPAGLSLLNLLTVGAVDASGSETDFSSFGASVVVHANGAEVESLIPGGDTLKCSGTSMASPQVANLAAKLFALKPDLEPVQVKELMLQGADVVHDKAGKPSRVILVNPRKSAALGQLSVETI